MTYKEFIAWCHERACDGLWGIQTAMFCLSVITTMKSVPFWQRKKLWLKIKDNVEVVVSIANDKIKELKE
ncbi:MAG: hypothetical protein J6D27_03545 [Ruminiclostridium sp.]|nr:hypothetical protein [Ruminiclostridium sp.]